MRKMLYPILVHIKTIFCVDTVDFNENDKFFWVKMHFLPFKTWDVRLEAEFFLQMV